MTLCLMLAALSAEPTLAERTGTARSPLAQPPAMEGCDASELRDVVGRSLDDGLKARAQSDSGAVVTRVFKTGDAVTQDRRSDRLNLELDASGKVVSARCF